MRDIARGRIAAVDSTRVPIIDVDWSVVNPSHRIAAIDGARIVVIGVDWIVMDTSHRIAAIGRARVVVVGVDWRSRAASPLTTISRRTGIAVTTSSTICLRRVRAHAA